MRCLLMVFLSATSAVAQVSVSIGINVPVYPELARVPGYPVYYAPRMNANFFFYDGMYWVYQRDNWYASSWYNGPWEVVAPQAVPMFVLRIPVRYYRNPPEYFRGWQRNAPPRWGDHWGNDWAQHHSGWDTWDRRSVPRPAPLPVYQKKYTGDRYPQAERQQDLRSQHYRYQPRDAQVHRYDQEQRQSPQDSQRVIQAPKRQQAAPVAPRMSSPQTGGGAERRFDSPQISDRPAGPAAQERQQPPKQGAAQREQQAPAARQGKAESQENERGQKQEKPRESGEDRGQGRNK